MAYKGVAFTGDVLGTKTTSQVICTFNISGYGSLHMKVYATTDASEATAFKLQHSPDGVTWYDVKTSGETGTTHTINVNAHDTTTYASITPLYPLGRVVANADMDVTSLYVIMDR